MENKKYLNDLSEIREMMSRSSRFISLSGLSGVFAGVYAIIGAAVAKSLLASHGNVYDKGANALSMNTEDSQLRAELILVAVSVLILAIATAIFLTTRKAKKNNQKIWDSTSRRLLTNFFAPLSAGGMFCLVLLQYELVGLIAPAMLLFYGMSLVNASKYTFSDLRSLGYANMLLGLIATQFIGYGIYFWAMGFGVFHIIYGLVMYNKYERKRA
ncbi:hypothetical protein RM549_02925 [Salegentibacter sp. F188]|uniref:Beta-carotene 15,15'-monooxygenase n=1 Tax=Autumnicola patrickiae TaxID=3075591 RepID=A0ABU3DYB8_9FLAO|nr:hypothetical protein [Salegentibacter sp. F188]MDT0688719.1 hypothetical protein [Salegentibacter sp. F188]